MARTILGKLKSLFGIGGSRAPSVIPKAGRGGGKLDFDVGGGTTLSNLKYAIENRLPVSYFYVDKWQPATQPGARGQREGNPHAIWTMNGKTYVHLYVDPRSASASAALGEASLPGWRTFILDRAQNVNVITLGRSFFGKDIRFKIAPGFNPGWYSRVGSPVAIVKP